MSLDSVQHHPAEIRASRSDRGIPPRKLCDNFFGIGQSRKFGPRNDGFGYRNKLTLLLAAAFSPAFA
jgi:hypothetical protein